MHHILAVDDEQDIIEMYQDSFYREIKDGKFCFFYANDGEEALHTLETNPQISVVLADINMPGMDGLAFLGRVAQQSYLDQPYQFVKVVMVTAYGDMKNIRKAFNFGAFDFLMKPWNFNDVEITINKAIREVEKLRAFYTRFQQEQERRMQLERELADMNSKLSGSLGIPAFSSL